MRTDHRHAAERHDRERSLAERAARPREDKSAYRNVIYRPLHGARPSRPGIYAKVVTGHVSVSALPGRAARREISRGRGVRQRDDDRFAQIGAM